MSAVAAGALDAGDPESDATAVSLVIGVVDVVVDPSEPDLLLLHPTRTSADVASSTVARNLPVILI